MQAKGLSFQFQLSMAMVSCFFWIFDWIPGVNIITNAIYTFIWFLVFVYKYLPLLRSIAKSGVAIGNIYTKILLIQGTAFVLGSIPFVAMFPWKIIANIWINRLVKQMLAKIDTLKKDVGALKQNWGNHWRAFNRRGKRGELPPLPDDASEEDIMLYQRAMAEQAAIEEEQYAFDQAVADQQAVEAQEAAAEEEAEEIIEEQERKKREEEENEAEINGYSVDESDPTLQTVTNENIYDILKKKPNHTPEEKILLQQADMVYNSGVLPVYARENRYAVAAYEKYQKERVESRTMRKIKPKSEAEKSANTDSQYEETR
jgi:hypothetical protein